MSLEPELVRERPRLLALAYRMLGSMAEAEDVVQDAYARCSEMPSDAIRSLPALLTTVVTRLSINALQSARVRREQYVGPWFPEPVTELAEIDPASISFAFLLLLETLGPSERAAFLLHKVFDYTHEEIADTLGIEVAASRQLVHRAKQHIERGKPRFRSDPSQVARLQARFAEVAQGGDLAGLRALLTDDVVARADHGGKASAARKPLVGADTVSKFIHGLLSKMPTWGAWLQTLDINGEPATIARTDGLLISVMTFVLDGERVAEINMVRNPDKLEHLAAHLGLGVYREPGLA